MNYYTPIEKYIEYQRGNVQNIYQEFVSEDNLDNVLAFNELLMQVINTYSSL